MAGIFWDSFDHYSTAQMGLKWTVPNGSIASAAARTGGFGLNITSASAAPLYRVAVSKEHATFIQGVAVKRQVSTSVINLNFYGDGSGTLHITVRVNADGSIQVLRAGSVSLGQTAANLIPIDQYHYIEAKVTLSDTVGVVEVRLDGSATPVLNITGADTKNAGTGTVLTAIQVDVDAAASYIDDLYLLNGAGAVLNNFLGDTRVSYLSPSGSGTTQQLTANTGNNSQAVDEVGGGHDSATTYVSSATVDQFDTYAMADLPAGAGLAHGLQWIAVAQKSDTAVRSVAAMLRSGGTDYTGVDQVLSASWAMYSQLYELNPDGNVAWTPASVNALEAGGKVR